MSSAPKEDQPHFVERKVNPRVYVLGEQDTLPQELHHKACKLQNKLKRKGIDTSLFELFIQSETEYYIVKEIRDNKMKTKIETTRAYIKQKEPQVAQTNYDTPPYKTY